MPIHQHEQQHVQGLDEQQQLEDGVASLQHGTAL